MKNESQVALRFYHYLKVVRDSLEYSMKDAKLKTLDFENRRSFLEDSMKEGEILATLIKNNGENGEKVKERLEEFISVLYRGSIVIPNGEFVRIDNAQKISVFQQVVGMRETFLDIVMSHINYLKEEGKLEPRIEELVKLEDYIYRSLASFLLIDSMRESFIEFNRYLNESKGEKTPQSNFVANDIGNYVGMLNFVKSRKIFDEPYFKDLEEASEKQMQLIQGKLVLNSQTERENIFINAKAMADKTLADAEKKWVAVYLPIVEDLKIREEEIKKSA